MKQEEIIEGNKLIAKFITIGIDDDGYHYFDHPIMFESKPSYFKNFRFHESWDWLMPVVSKIMKLGYHVVFEMKSSWDESTFSIYSLKCGNELIDPYIAMEDYSPDNLLEYVWFSVVEFIKWYNERNK